MPTDQKHLSRLVAHRFAANIGVGSLSRPEGDAVGQKISNDLSRLVADALAEDIGTGDLTSQATVAPDLTGRALVRQKAPGVVAGLAAATEVFRQLGIEQVQWLVAEGSRNKPGTDILRLEGNARALLAAERTALQNFLGHLSGIATATAQAVDLVSSSARILDTRKTTPGLRMLEKAAVAAGGGVNHRIGLFDAILVKENHIALSGGVGSAVARAKASSPGVKVIVEVRDPDEIDQALAAGADRLLLDNMSPEQIAAAVRQADGRAELEASGGINASNLPEFGAIEGLTYISLGAITHSAPALDLSMYIEIGSQARRGTADLEL